MNSKFLKISNLIINPNHIVSANYKDKETGREYLKLTLTSTTPETTYDGDLTGGSSSVIIMLSGEQAVALWKVLEAKSYVVI